ncbi:MAG: hypothetical protein KFH87_09790 [Bacteroidetes bacterium]|nr:hypothetical protein [Bacteroidota bacterium]
MKAVMITYNQTLNDKIEFILDRLDIRGFTRWNEIDGRGSETGNPRMGTHTWPERNDATLVVIPDDKVDALLGCIRAVDELNTGVGIRAFVWNVERSY